MYRERGTVVWKKGVKMRVREKNCLRLSNAGALERLIKAPWRM